MCLYDSYDDDELVRLLKQGDLKAFTAIHGRYYPVLYKHAYSKLPDNDEIQDLLQDVFMVIWNNRNNLNFESCLAAYLATAVRNRIFNIFKHHKVKVNYIDSFEAFLVAKPSLPDEAVRIKELVAIIAAEVNTLPPQMRRIFQMSREGNLSHREIAEELKISPATVKKQVTNSLKILRMKLRFHINLFFF